MGSINLILAKLFDSFKLKNPVAAAIVLGLLAGFIVALQQYEFFGDKTTVVLEWVVFVLAALTGSRTYSTIQEAKESEKKL